MLYRFIDLFNGAIIPLIAVLIIFSIVKKAGVKKTILIVVLTLYLAEMFDIVGIPYAQVWGWNPIINMIPFCDLPKEEFSFGAIFQFAANIVLFLPLGILLPVIWKHFRKFTATMMVGVFMSFVIEFVQLFSARVTAIDDLLMNTLGTIIGYLCIFGLSKKRWRMDGSNTGRTAIRDSIELLIVVSLVFISTIFVKYYIGSLVYSLYGR